MKTTLYITCCAALLLSACGGSEFESRLGSQGELPTQGGTNPQGGTGPQGGSTLPSISLSTIDARYATFEAVTGKGIPDIDESDFTPGANVPKSGFSVYTGIVGVGVYDENDDAVFLAAGATTMNSYFSFGAVSGTANNFYELSDDSPSTPIDGELSYDLDRILDGINVYSGDMTGSISPTDLPEINLDGPARGVFSWRRCRQLYRFQCSPQSDRCHNRHNRNLALTSPTNPQYTAAPNNTLTPS